MSASQGEAARTAAAETFNMNLRWLVGEVGARLPGDRDVDEIRRKVAVACDQLPCAPVESVGPYLFKYKDEIYAGKTEGFLESEYADEQKGAGPGAEIAARLIPAVKGVWKDAPEEKQKEFLGCVQDLLDSFLDYSVTLVGDDIRGQ